MLNWLDRGMMDGEYLELGKVKLNWLEQGWVDGMSS